MSELPRRSALLAGGLLLFGLAPACRSSSADSTPPPRKAPASHRPSAAACTTARPPGRFDPKLSGCHQDSECSDAREGKRGRCNQRGGGHSPVYNACDYDQCAVDADCPQKGLCICDGQRETGRHVCLPGNCHVDADCGPRGFCSPSQGGPPSGGCWGYAGYYCHTAKDACVEHEDCRRDRGESCAWLPELGHWGCTVNNACPVG